MLHYAVLAFFASFILSLLVIRLYARWRGLGERGGPQQFHKGPTPRFGGLGLYLSLWLCIALTYFKGDAFFEEFLLLSVISTPVFLAGLVEDITHALSPKTRLTIIALSSALAFFLLDAQVRRVDLPLVDSLITFFPISFAFTVCAITGISNAVNIIDGFNGLASMVCFTILMGIAYVSYKLGDYALTTMCVTFAFALLGFFLLNYPYGFIFLGDSGAYMSGFVIGVLSVILVRKHAEVSPWFALLINFYPVFETLFSIYRRKFIKYVPLSRPDALHLHSLFYKILTKKLLGVSRSYLRNPAVSPFMWILNLLAVVPAVLFWNNTNLLMLFTLLFVLIYTILYWKLLLSKIPSWAKMNRRRLKG